MFGDYVNVVFDTVVAGILYEQNKLQGAKEYAIKIERFSDDYRRSLDLIETLILKSIALWKLKNHEESIIQMQRAVATAERHGYVRLFANEGAEVVTILQKLVNTVKAHLYKLYEKLEVQSAADAVIKARKLGLI